jgi:hypothetical protein
LVETNSSGGYLFEGLNPLEEYAVEFDLNTIPHGYIVTTPNDEEATEMTDSDADIDTGRTETVTLIAGEQYLDLDMGIKQDLFLIGTHFWIDENGNSIYDGKDIDTPIPDALVELLDENGNKLYWTDETNISLTIVETIFPAEMRTSEDGEYGFNVPEGTYQIKFTIPKELEGEGYAFVDQGNNKDDAVNMNVVDAFGITQPVAVGPGIATQNLTLDAAIDCPCANITSDSGNTLSTVSILLMILIILSSGLLVVRREEKGL